MEADTRRFTAKEVKKSLTSTVESNAEGLLRVYV